MNGNKPRNSFDALRLIAAGAVAAGHQVDLAGWPEPAVGSLGISLSNTALIVFFAMSGYLVWQSLERDSRPRRFFASRLSRIYPGAIVNTIFCVVFGALVTSVDSASYWSDPRTWSYLMYGVGIIATPTDFVLPGVFTDARWPNVNTPIWTLKYEMVCYLGAFLLYRLLVPKVGAKAALAATTGLLAAGAAWYFSALPLPDAERFYTRYNAFNILRFGTIFSYGAFLAAVSDGKRTSWHLATYVLPAILIALVSDPALNRVGQILLVALVAVEIGRTPMLFNRMHRRVGDLSYGVYLYAYPTGAYFTTRLYNGANFWCVFGVTSSVVIALAFASWWLIEKPILKMLLVASLSRTLGGRVEPV